MGACTSAETVEWQLPVCAGDSVCRCDNDGSQGSRMARPFKSKRAMAMRDDIEQDDDDDQEDIYSSDTDNCHRQRGAAQPQPQPKPTAAKKEKRTRGPAAGQPWWSCWQADAVKRVEKWTFVGERKGGYELVSSYDYVGPGGGSYMPSGQQSWCCCCCCSREALDPERPGICSPCCVRALCVLTSLLSLLTIVVAALFLWSPAFLERLRAGAASDEVLAAGKQMIDMLDDLAESSNQSQGANATAFDCKEVQNQLASLSAEYQDWCCQHRGVACAANRMPTNHDEVPTAAAAHITGVVEKKSSSTPWWSNSLKGPSSSSSSSSPSSFSTSTPLRPSSIITQSPEEGGNAANVPEDRDSHSPKGSVNVESPCETICNLHGGAYTCSARVAWTASHEFLSLPTHSACEAAHKEVLRGCATECKDCSLDASLSVCVTVVDVGREAIQTI
mmetsp:Transcript_41377/g.88880  ORF Transcript_41377/g.88880 Transcript_41377/m.88880 type:complete len:446 (-) Transcript_41377:59-1396(-)